MQKSARQGVTTVYKTRAETHASIEELAEPPCEHEIGIQIVKSAVQSYIILRCIKQ